MLLLNVLRLVVRSRFLKKVAEYLRSNITMLKWMISQGYGDARTMARRVENMEKWLKIHHFLKLMLMLNTLKCTKSTFLRSQNQFFAARTTQMMQTSF